MEVGDRTGISTGLERAKRAGGAEEAGTGARARARMGLVETGEVGEGAGKRTGGAEEAGAGAGAGAGMGLDWTGDVVEGTGLGRVYSTGEERWGGRSHGAGEWTGVGESESEGVRARERGEI